MDIGESGETARFLSALRIAPGLDKPIRGTQLRPSSPNFSTDLTPCLEQTEGRAIGENAQDRRRHRPQSGDHHERDQGCSFHRCFSLAGIPAAIAYNSAHSEISYGEKQVCVNTQLAWKIRTATFCCLTAERHLPHLTNPGGLRRSQSLSPIAD